MYLRRRERINCCCQPAKSSTGDCVGADTTGYINHKCESIISFDHPYPHTFEISVEHIFITVFAPRLTEIKTLGNKKQKNGSDRLFFPTLVTNAQTRAKRIAV